MSEVRLVVAILVPAIFTLILKDFFDLFMTNRYEGKVKQYTIWMLYFLLDTAISMNFKFVGVISVKESRGQPKSGALKQATCKGNF